MLLCLSDANLPTASSELKKKTCRKSDIQIANGNEKLDAMLSQFSEPKKFIIPIGNTHNDFHVFASIITERLDNTLKYPSNYYLRKRVKKSVKKRQHKIKQKRYWLVFKKTIKVIKNTVEFKPSFTRLFWRENKRIAQDSQINMS